MATTELHLFDVCVITVSDEAAVEKFSTLIEERRAAGVYPREIDFRVYADPPAGRIGSGGGTMWALLELLRDLGVEDAADYFSKTRIVMLHAGGESRRLPCYAPEGKLFAPIPLSTSSVVSPVVLDAQLSLFLRYPWRDGELLLGSGDVVIDFDTSAMKRPTAAITGFGAPASLQEGSQHGVFRFDPTGERVEEYYQKQPVPFLHDNAAIEGTDQCALDIGLISMAPEFTIALAEIGRQLRAKLAQAQVYVDVYLEILTACLAGLSMEQYLERIELQSKADESVKKALYTRLHPFELGGVLTLDPQFIHFGSLHEYPEACRKLNQVGFLPFYATERGELAPASVEPALVFNSDPDQPEHGSARCYVENCGRLGESSVAEPSLGDGAGLVGVRAPSKLPSVPSDIWIDERDLETGRVFLVYGTGDTFKPAKTLANLTFCGIPMDQWLDARGLSPKDIWNRPDIGDLWEARLFSPALDERNLAFYWSAAPSESAPAAPSESLPAASAAPSESAPAAPSEALPAAPALSGDEFRKMPRISLRDAARQADPRARDESRTRRRTELLRARLAAGRGWRTISRTDFCRLFPDRRVPERLLETYNQTVDPLLAAYRRRVVAECGSLPKRLGGDGAQRRIRYVTPTRDSFALRRAVKEDQIVWARCPVRLDLAGGWTDTPPYTNRYGGKVVNLAVNLNGEPPIQVYCRPTSEHRVRFHSIDLGVTETLSTTREILDFQNPTSPFALPKAALVLLGVVDEGGGDNLEERLRGIGCGVEVTLMCAIPKGSGLGTSSVLGGTILAALARFFGVEMTKDELYLNVLAMEQMLTTGGGWQDQVGGIAGAVKYIESASGMRPRPEVHQLDPYLFADRHYTERMTLFYTGITRLAKNILQEVVDRVNDYEPAYLFTHRYLTELATDARRMIALRDYFGLCRVVASSWRANKLIHESTSNEEIESILHATRDVHVSAKLLGAGGGGYALFLSKSARDADGLRETLERDFDNGRSRLVDFALNPEGLRVSVS